MFVDLFMHCTGWNQSWAGTGFNVGPDGMLTAGIGGTWFYTGGYPSGNYQFYGEGSFSIGFPGPNHGFVPGTLKTEGNVTTGLVKITNPPPSINDGAIQNEILIGISVNDPSNPPANLHLIAPGYPAWPNTNATFTTQYLQALQPFTCFRMMDWMGTNESTITTWASRPQPDVWGNSQSGNAYERFIELANTLNRDLWINIPLHATDDWAIGMAQLLKANLKPGLNVYIEVSNELWNSGFYGDWQTVETWGQTNSALTTTSSWARHGQEVAYLLMHFVGIMQPIMGSQARFILAGQVGNNITCSAGLQWIQQVYGPPSNYIFGIASAPYLGNAYGDPGSSVDDLFASEQGCVAGLMQEVQQGVALARQFGLQFCVYECGQGFGSSATNASAILQAAQLDPRIVTLYQSLASGFQANGVYLANFYNFVYGWGGNNYWGAIPDLQILYTPSVAGQLVKYQAEVAIAKAGRQNAGYVAAINPPITSTAAATTAAQKASAKAAVAAALAAAKAQAAAARAASKTGSASKTGASSSVTTSANSSATSAKAAQAAAKLAAEQAAAKRRPKQRH